MNPILARIFKIAELVSLYTIILLLFVGGLFHASDPSVFLRSGSYFIWISFACSIIALISYGGSFYYSNNNTLFEYKEESPLEEQQYKYSGIKPPLSVEDSKETTPKFYDPKIARPDGLARKSRGKKGN